MIVVTIVTCIVALLLLMPDAVTANGLLTAVHFPECTPSPETFTPELVLVITQPLGMEIATDSVPAGSGIETTCWICEGVGDGVGVGFGLDGCGCELELDGGGPTGLVEWGDVACGLGLGVDPAVVSGAAPVEGAAPVVV